MPEIFADVIAWMPYRSKPHKRTNSSSRESPVAILDIFGLQAENVTLLDATDQVRSEIFTNRNHLTDVKFIQICSHQMRTDGSGVDQVLRSAQPPKETLAIGVIPEDTTKLNQTTERPLR